MLRVLLGALVAQAANLPFLTVWRTTTASETVSLPLSVPLVFNISWGDGSTEIINRTFAAHVYSLPGLYSVPMLGDIYGFRFSSGESAPQLMEIVSWGDSFIMDNTSSNAFAGCANLQISASPSTQPVFLPGATLEGMFMDNTNINSSLNWDLSNVTSVALMFARARNMNQPVTFWNTLGLTSTAGMFQNATAFNQPVLMQTNNVTNMTFMFQGASKFNQALNFNTGMVTNMNSMFDGAEAFNQSINFDGSSLVQVDYMFRNAIVFNQLVNLTNTLALTSTVGMFNAASAFNQPITLQTDNVTSMLSMFESASSFNQPIPFNTAKVQSTSFMFSFASAFNQPINFDTTWLSLANFMFSWATSFNSPVNFSNTSALTAVQGMFQYTAKFNQPLSFQTDNVYSMWSMFSGSAFNQPVVFNTRNVQSMNAMFSDNPRFNQPINFDGTSLVDASWMFAGFTAFNNIVNLTNTSALTYATGMFQGAISFNQPLLFQTDNVISMRNMFHNANRFNQPVMFNTGKVQDMYYMFNQAHMFNQPINFDGANLTTAGGMFANAYAFNSPVNLTNTLLLENTMQMFENALAFNMPVQLQTGNVRYMNQMFNGAIVFNQPIVFNTTSLISTDFMFAGTNVFNSAVNFTLTPLLATLTSMFERTAVFNQPLSFNISTVISMSSMFKGARMFNQPLLWSSTDTRNVLGMASLFEDAVSFNRGINFQVDKLVTAKNMFKGATSFNQPIVLLNSSHLISMEGMLANATSFRQTLNISSTANVNSMNDAFANALGFSQDLGSWNVSSVANCSNFCDQCGLPDFQLCMPCATGQTYVSAVCNCTQCDHVSVAPTSSSSAPSSSPSSSSAPSAAPSGVPTNGPTTTAAPTPSNGGPTICATVQVSPTLQVECVDETLSPSPGHDTLPGIISPLFNITAPDNTSNGVFVFTLPIDPQLYVQVGSITRPCETQELSCEWQDAETLQFQRSGCAVSRTKVDMGSGVVGTECTCTHLTVFALALRSSLQLAPLCQAQEVDYALVALYAILGCCLVVQVARIIKYQSPGCFITRGGANSAQVSVVQHSLLLVVCVLRILYIMMKPVIASLSGLVLLGLLPSAITLSLFIHLLLTWASLQVATFEMSPFARFRLPFLALTLLVFAVIVVLAILAEATPEVDTTVRNGSYVLAALYAAVCALVLVSGLGMRNSISVVDAVRNTDWRVVVRCRLLVVTVGLSTCLFLAACLWVAAVQTDIVTSTAGTLATTASFYAFDWLSMCVLTWLFSFAVTSSYSEVAKGSESQTRRIRRATSSSREDSKKDFSSRTQSTGL